MTWHGYFAVEDLNLNAAQRHALIAELRALGPSTARQPAHLNHWRVSLDGSKAIFEAAFNEDVLTIEAFKRRLATIFSVSWVTIGNTLANVTFADRPTPVAVFSRTGTNYLRFALFGGTGATWEQSRIEVLAYLAANLEEWDGNELS